MVVFMLLSFFSYIFAVGLVIKDLKGFKNEQKNKRNINLFRRRA